MATPDHHEVLDTRALNRALLARQLLLERSAMDVPAALEHLVGLQAQAPQTPYPALWSRLDRFDPSALSDLIAERSVVRVVLMRGTIHAVTAADALRLRPIIQPLLDTALSGGRTGRELEGLDHGDLTTATLALLDDGPVSYADLGVGLAARWTDRDPDELRRAGRVLVPLVQLPPRGLWRTSGPAVHASLVEWLGRPLDPDGSVDELVVRYLRAFGPASVPDIATWSGLTGLQAVVERLSPKLRRFADPSGRTLHDVTDGLLPDAGTAAPPRFLPDFDNLWLSHADRTRIVPEVHRTRLIKKNASGCPVFLVDGFVAGAWRLERRRTSTTLVIDPFEPLATTDRDMVADEGRRLLDFLAPDAGTTDLRFS
jgi:hypothetical protein